MNKVLKFACVCIIVTMFVISLAGCSSGKETNSNTKKTTTSNVGDSGNERQYKNDAKSVKANIEIEALGLTNRGDFGFRVKNKNNQPVYIDSVNIIFKDEQGNFALKASSEMKYFAIESNSEVVNYAWGFEKDFSKYPNYEFEIELSGDYMSRYYKVGGFDVIANNTGSQIAVAVKNNNKESINDLRVVVAFYKDEKLVECVSGYNNTTVEEGDTAYINVRYPEDSQYQETSFDKYETYLLTAGI